VEKFTVTELTETLGQTRKPYHELIRLPSMSAGLYKLAAGAEDKQQPHTEDEMYYVVEGKAQFQSESESVPVEAGTILFVEANREHRFHSITEDLTVLVFFAPAEYTNKRDSSD